MFLQVPMSLRIIESNILGTVGQFGQEGNTVWFSALGQTEPSQTDIWGT